MSPAGFEHTISTGEQPQTHALDRAATGIGRITLKVSNPEVAILEGKAGRGCDRLGILYTARDRTVSYMCFLVGKKVGKSLIIQVFFGCYAVSTGK